MGELTEKLISKLHEAGGFAIGFAPLREVDSEVFERYKAWLADGRNGEMSYLANNLDIRRNPALLLDNGNDPQPGGTIISIAFPYFSASPYKKGKLKIARYALGDDYHEVLRNRLRPVAAWLTEQTNKEARICVDTAPILERYWAEEAGIGYISRNRQLTIPGHGSCFFLAEIVTRATLQFDRLAYQPRLNKIKTINEQTCINCGACIKACPGNALEINNFDSRKCHSYLTIEFRGELPDSFHPLPNVLYGCDRCIEVCPMLRNSTAPTPLPEFQPREPLLNLTTTDIEALAPDEYATLLRHSPIKRAKLSGLIRNCQKLNKEKN